jgi:hypothetical protein
VERHTALHFTWIRADKVSGQHQHIARSSSAFSEVPLAHVPPDSTGFTGVPTASPSSRSCLDSLYTPFQPYIGYD